MDRSRTYRSKSTAAAVVQLGATRRMFYTSTMGSPDVLFMVLLTSAREAYAITGASSSSAARDDRATGLQAEIYLAGSLLCDESFIPARVSPDCGHYYALDLVKNRIELRTQVYGSTVGRSCLFGVTLKGSVLGTEFVLLNTSTGSLLANIVEDVIREPTFFRDELPRLAYQVETQQGEATEESRTLVDQALELQVVIPMEGKSSSLTIKKRKAANHAEVYSAETGDLIGNVTLGCLQRMIRAALSQLKASPPSRVSGHMSCFLEILNVVIKGSNLSAGPEPTTKA